MKIGERWIIGINILTLIMTIVIAWIYSGQLSEMKTATQESRLSADAAAEGSIENEGQFERTVKQLIYQTASQADSAKQSRKIADVTRESLEKVERAFANPLINYATTFDPKSGALVSAAISFKWENEGVTAAKRFTAHSSYDFTSPSIYEDRWLVGVPHIHIPTYIAPKGTAYSTAVLTLTAPQLEALSQSKSHIYFWGWARYEDVFKNTRPHITRYCNQVTILANKDALGKLVGYALSPDNCPSGNCADEDCPVQ